MTTVADFVRDTLGVLGVVDPRQPVQAVDMQTGIRFLNRLMTRLEADGTSFGWSNVSAPGDTLPLPPESEMGVMYVLAIVLAPQYSTTVSPEIAAGAARFGSDNLRDQAVATPIQQLVDLPCGGKDIFGPVAG